MAVTDVLHFLDLMSSNRFHPFDMILKHKKNIIRNKLKENRLHTSTATYSISATSTIWDS